MTFLAFLKGGKYMASVLMGATTALIVFLVGCSTFYIGYRLGSANSQNIPQETKTKAELTEEQKRVAEGFNNMLNYANRHKGGDRK